MKIYVINLKRAQKRKIHMQQQLRNCRDKVMFVEGIDGKPSNMDIQINATREMLPGKIGCFLSHRKVWQIIADSQEWGLVLEDDVELEDDWNMLIKQAVEIPLS